MGSLHSFLARIGTMNLPHVRFGVERFSADFRMFRNGTTTALKRSTTNHSHFGRCSTIPRFMERIKVKVPPTMLIYLLVVHRGARFSRKAFTPSLQSSVCRTDAFNLHAASSA